MGHRESCALIDLPAVHKLHVSTLGLVVALGCLIALADQRSRRHSIVQTVIAVDREVQFGSSKTARGRRAAVLDPGTARRRGVAGGRAFTRYGGSRSLRAPGESIPLVASAWCASRRPNRGWQ